MEEFYLVNGKILDVRTGKFIKYILHSNLIMNLRKSYAYPIKKQLKSRRFSMDFALTVR